MKTILKKFRDGIVIGLGILFVFGIANAINYTATTGETLTATKWNDLVAKVNGVFTDGTGNVGIGTETPNTKLQVSTTGNSAISVRQTDPITNGKWAQLILSQGSTFFGGADKSWQIINNGNTDGSSDLRFDLWNGVLYNNYMIIKEGGNVGIGTTAPATKLDVNGKLKLQADATVVTSGTDTIPESYKFSRTDCNVTTRGSIFVGRPSGAGNQDGLCACMNIDNIYEWVCFNP